MGLELSQTLNLRMKQEQRLVMTPQMQQAITLLQLAHHELIEHVNDELMENPVLEEREEGDEDEGGGAPQEQTSSHENEFSELPILQEVPSEEGLSMKEEDQLRDDVEWRSYVADSFSRPPASGGQVLSTDDDYTPIEGRITSKPTLLEHLEWQLGVSGFHEKEQQIGAFILGNLDRYGYLIGFTTGEIAQELGVEQAQVESVLYRIQAFDPVGVGARSLSECLMLQAEYYGFLDEIMEAILENHIKELERKDYTKIAKCIGVPLKEVHERIKLILTLDPKPGRAYSNEEISYIVPDVYIYPLGDGYRIVLNDDGLPKLKVSKRYENAMKRGDVPKEYVEDKMRKAKWFINSIYQRQRTITKVTESIVKFQREFLEKGIIYMKPLTLKDVAEDVGRHESTVSRVTTNKYVHTPQGLFELKYFFSSAVQRVNGEEVASQSVKEKIRLLIEEEDSKKPLSDQRIADILFQQGINVARRTVAKYREQLHILSSSRRRSTF